MKKKIWALILGATLLLPLVACGPAAKEEAKKDVATGATEQETKKETKKETEKILRVGMPFFGADLDPANGYNGWYLMRLGVGEALVFISEEMTTTPWLATEFKAQEDGSWVMIIDEEARFHNGKNLTAEAVKKSIERSIAINKRAQQAFEGASFEAKGDQLIVKTPTFDPVVPEKLSDPMFIIVDTEEADQEMFQKSPVCTGPYRVAEFVPNEKARVIRFADYPKTAPKLDEVEYIKIEDANTRMMALQSGEIQVAIGLSAAQTAVIEKDDALVTDRVPSLRVIYGMLNTQNPFLADAKVREALNFGLDKETLGTKHLGGTLMPADGPYPPTMPFGKEDLKVFSYDLEKATNLLKEAGFADENGDGILEKEGKALSLRITYYSSRAEMPIIAQYMQSEYRKLGIDIQLVTYEKLPKDQYGAGDFDIGFDSYTVATSANPKTLLDIGFLKDASDNYNNYYFNEKIEEIGKALAQEGDIKKRIALAKEAERIIVEDAMNIFIGYPQNAVSRKKEVKGFYVHPLDFYQLNAETDME